MASLTEEPGEAMANGDFLGAAGAGASSFAVVCGGCCFSGTGAGAWAVAGFCCIACWPAGGGAGALGAPALRASSSLRNVSLSTDGVFELARRSLSETIFVLGGVFGFERSSGRTTIMFSGFSLSGTMTAWFLVHFGTSKSSAIMMPCVTSEIHAASRRRYVETTSSARSTSSRWRWTSGAAGVSTARSLLSAAPLWASITGINHHQPTTGLVVLLVTILSLER